MDFQRFENAHALRDRALPFLLESEAEHGLLVGLLLDIERLPENALAAIVTDDDRTLGVALRLDTRLVVSRVDHAHALELLADSVATDPATVITGAQQTVEAIRERRAAPVSFSMAQVIYAADAVKQPERRVEGARRPMSERDRDLLIDARLELNPSLGAAESRDAAAVVVDQRIRGGNLYVWETPSGEAVSCAGTAGPMVHGIRVNYVYTPLKHRGRGYASALVADLTQALLDGGRSFVFLHADAANPTANAIYQRLGYEEIADFAMIRYAR